MTRRAAIITGCRTPFGSWTTYNLPFDIGFIVGKSNHHKIPTQDGYESLDLMKQREKVEVAAARYGLKHTSSLTGYTDVHPDFEAKAGFVPRVDMRQLSHFSSFFLRPEEGALTSWGPQVFAQALWDHDGQLLDERLEGSLEWNFVSNTGFEVNYRKATERLRPQDHPAITEIRAYDVGFWDIEFRTNSWDWLSVNGNFGWGHQTNFNPVEGKQPETGDWMWLNTSIAFRLNPWTAVYAGVNSNAQNLELVDTPGVGREL